MTQEHVAFLAVALAAIGLGFGGFRRYAAGPLAAWLLQRGRVSWAMRLKTMQREAGSSCDQCGPKS